MSPPRLFKKLRLPVEKYILLYFLGEEKPSSTEVKYHSEPSEPSAFFKAVILGVAMTSARKPRCPAHRRLVSD